MLSVNTNVAANTARTYSHHAESRQQVTMARLSSGSRVNAAADDAAGMAVSSKILSEIRGLNAVLKNTSDGISLAQVTDSSSQQITDIIIRLRELAIQNHNGVYTNQDRLNAEKEVNALVKQIDQVANNTSFNSVNLLDGTYLESLRTGNLNEEKMDVEFSRLHSDSLGGSVITTKQSTMTQVSQPSDFQNLTKIDAFEADQIRIETNTLSTDFQNFVSAAPNGSFSISGDDAGEFIVTSSGSIRSLTSILHNNTSSADISKSLSLTYTDTNGNTKTEQIALSVQEVSPKILVVRTATSQLTSDEATSVEIKAIAMPAGAGNNVLSAELQFYADSFPGGTFSIEGTDASHLTITQDGLISGNLFYNSPQDLDGDNVYEFAVKYEAPSGDSFLETVSLTITPTAPASALGAHDTTTDEFISGTQLDLRSIVEDGTFTPVMASVDLDGVGNNDYATFGFGGFFQNFVATHGSGGTFALQNITYTGPNSYDPNIHNLSIEPGNILTVGGPGLNDGVPQGDYFAELVYTVGGESFTYSTQMFADPGMAPSITLMSSDGFPTTSKTSFGNIQMGFDDLQFNVLEPPPATKFSMINMIAGMIPGGTLSISNVTAPPGGNTAHIQFDGSDFTLDKSLTAGTYTLDLTYAATGGSVSTSVEFVVAGPPAPPCISEASASGAAIAGSATDIFRDNGGNQTASALRTVTSQLGATEAKKLSFGVFDDPSVTSNELKNFAMQSPAGKFSLSGADSTHFTVYQDGTVNLIENADFERKSAYNFNIEYKSGSSQFTETISLNIADDNTDNVLHISEISISTAENAKQAVIVLDKALEQVNTFQSYVGSIQNRLQSSLELAYTSLDNASKSRGRMIDADFAAETQSMATQQILMQSAQSILVQANNSKQNILTLIG